jgi:hypothetical protein
MITKNEKYKTEETIDPDGTLKTVLLFLHNFREPQQYHQNDVKHQVLSQQHVIVLSAKALSACTFGQFHMGRLYV